jgi:D-methionine transport system substrate-binding protein
MRKKFSLLATGAVAALALTACGGGDSAPSAEVTTLDPQNPVTLTVGASPVPHTRILEFVDTELAADAGLDLEIQEIEDFQTPNTALSDGTLDANYFQHQPFFEQQVQDKGYDFAHGEPIHIEPYAAFSETVEEISALSDGARIAITNDPSNQVRALELLEAEGLLQNIEADSAALTLTDEQNPKNLEFSENQPELLVNDMRDPSIDMAILNGNYFIAAGLNVEDALAVEDTQSSQYGNFLAWRAEDEGNVAIQKLDELLHSEEVKQFITETWPNGDVIPAS